VPQDPRFTREVSGTSLRLSFAGDWTIGAAGIEALAESTLILPSGISHVIMDIGGISRLDTAGAWLLDRSRQNLSAGGIEARIESAKPEHEILLHEAGYRSCEALPARHLSTPMDLLADLGESTVGFLKDLYEGTAFFGEVIASLGKSLRAPRSFRFTSLIAHMEAFGLRSVPIIVLINFLVGAIVAQQGIFQLQRFGATTFAVDLIGLLILRELAVFLTSIMIAGRTGAAITAELGSMKMREEIDALSVMGLSAIDVLIVPRLLALMLCLPLLTFIADMAALFGGLLVTWVYGGISPETFLVRLQAAISLHTFLAGLIKAPFMALVIGLIASIEGLSVEGSAESLGRQVTSAVVKSIFMVIVVDGLFAMFFASIKY
jgi:phospholipid/cholesterol/gamma-HCH transport system permease protein